MTSTNMFQGLSAKNSSRVLQPPGGGSSNLFGGYEEDTPSQRRPNKTVSKVFAPPEEPQSVSRRSYPPGGKSSGIFGDPDPPARQQKHPPGGQSSNIFGAAESTSGQNRGHPNKPKDNLSVVPEPESSPVPEAKVSPPEVKEAAAPPAPEPVKEEPAPVSAPAPRTFCDLCPTSPLKNHQDEQNQAQTPPGKGPLAGVRSPSFGRQPPSLRGARLHLPNAGVSGGRNLPRSLLGSTAGSEAESGVFAVPTTLPPNSSRHNRMFSPNKEAELALKQQLDSISMQSDIFLSRQRKPRNRQLRKPLVVQRTLLPRTTGDTPQHVCSFSILSNSSATGTGSFRPIHTRLAPSSRPLQSKASPSASSSAAASQLSSAIDLAAKSAGIIPGSPCREPDSLTAHTALLNSTPSVDAEPGPQLLQHNVPENGHLSPSPRASGGADSLLAPPSVASLLDISLPGPPEETPGESHTHISDSLIELAINSAHYGAGEEAGLSPAKLSNNDGSKLLSSSPSVSPSRGWIPSPSHDPQWYPSDSSDSTLGCLLSSMVSPDKGKRTTLTPSGPSSGTALLGPSLLDCNSHDSFQSRGLPDVAEMDSQLACMMSESSVDYIARFNDLAQELAVTEPPPPEETRLQRPSAAWRT
nr:PREDICTED: protein cramped-like [Notothenia coriiceps]